MIKKLFLALIALMAVSVAITMFQQSNQPSAPPKTAEEIAKEGQLGTALAAAQKLRSMQKDPASFSIDTALLMNDGAACFEFRSRNSFNALVGSQAVFDGSRILAGGAEATRLWNSKCAGKEGRDITSIVRRSL